MRKKSVVTKLGGWVAYSSKNPEAVLWAIWARARVKDCGLLPSDPDTGCLEFDGLRIEISNGTTRVLEEIANGGLYHKIRILITDEEKIHSGFFDLWFEMVADGVVRDGPSLEDKKLFASPIEQESIDRMIIPDINQITSASELELVKWVFLWENRYPKKRKGYTAEDWLIENNAPAWINYKKIQRKREEIRESQPRKN